MKFGMRILEGIKHLQAEQRIKNEAARRSAEFMHKSEESYRAMKKYKDRPLRKSKLATGIPNLPFSDGEYATDDRYLYDYTNKKAYLSETDYFVTTEALNAVRKDIFKLEAMISPSKLGINSLPTFKVKLGKVPIYNAGEKPTGHRGVYLTVTPLTPTGKPPRYPAVIHFYNTPMSGEMFHGEISYLANGSMGKADITYCLDGATYKVAWRSKNGKIQPSNIKAIDPTMTMNPDVVLWRA